jgi:hypothetical protein
MCCSGFTLGVQMLEQFVNDGGIVGLVLVSY